MRKEMTKFGFRKSHLVLLGKEIGFENARKSINKKYNERLRTYFSKEK